MHLGVGQFSAKKVGQFGAKTLGQFETKSVGQFERFFHVILKQAQGKIKSESNE